MLYPEIFEGYCLHVCGCKSIYNMCTCSVFWKKGWMLLLWLYKLLCNIVGHPWWRCGEPPPFSPWSQFSLSSWMFQCCSSVPYGANGNSAEILDSGIWKHTAFVFLQHILQLKWVQCIYIINFFFNSMWRICNFHRESWLFLCGVSCCSWFVVCWCRDQRHAF